MERPYPEPYLFLVHARSQLTRREHRYAETLAAARAEADRVAKIVLVEDAVVYDTDGALVYRSRWAGEWIRDGKRQEFIADWEREYPLVASSTVRSRPSALADRTMSLSGLLAA